MKSICFFFVCLTFSSWMVKVIRELYVLLPDEKIFLHLLGVEYLLVNYIKVPLPLGDQGQDTWCNHCDTGWMPALVAPCPAALCTNQPARLYSSALRVLSSRSWKTGKSSPHTLVPCISEQCWLWQVLDNEKKCLKFYTLILVLLLKEWKYPLLRLLKITLQILYYSMSSLPQAEYLILVTGSSHDLFLGLGENIPCYFLVCSYSLTKKIILNMILQEY